MEVYFAFPTLTVVVIWGRSVQLPGISVWKIIGINDYTFDPKWHKLQQKEPSMGTCKIKHSSHTEGEHCFRAAANAQRIEKKIIDTVTLFWQFSLSK